MKERKSYYKDKNFGHKHKLRQESGRKKKLA